MKKPSEKVKKSRNRSKKERAQMEKAVTQVDIDYDEVLPVVQWGYPEDYHAKKAMCKANNATMISGHSSHHKKL